MSDDDDDVGVVRLPDGSGFFVAEIDASAASPPGYPVCWNPYNRVVQDHRDGTVDLDRTNAERAARGLPVPWTPELAGRELGITTGC